MFDELKFEKSQIKKMSATTLAFVGDCVYDLYMRMAILKEHPNFNNFDLSRFKFQYVKAGAQADAIRKISEILTEDEKKLVRWGRNARVSNIPKGATLSQYRFATAFEALIGYLYLIDDEARIEEIMKQTYTILKEEA